MKPLPRNHWVDLNNQKVFLDGLAQKFNIRSPMDWGKVTWDQVREGGGAGMLSRYGGSLFSAVKTGISLDC